MPPEASVMTVGETGPGTQEKIVCVASYGQREGGQHHSEEMGSMGTGPGTTYAQTRSHMCTSPCSYLQPQAGIRSCVHTHTRTPAHVHTHACTTSMHTRRSTVHINTHMCIPCAYTTSIHMLVYAHIQHTQPMLTHSINTHMFIPTPTSLCVLTHTCMYTTQMDLPYTHTRLCPDAYINSLVCVHFFMLQKGR